MKALSSEVTQAFGDLFFSVLKWFAEVQPDGSLSALFSLVLCEREGCLATRPRASLLAFHTAGAPPPALTRPALFGRTGGCPPPFPAVLQVGGGGWCLRSGQGGSTSFQGPSVVGAGVTWDAGVWRHGKEQGRQGRNSEPFPPNTDPALSHRDE